MMNKTFNPGKPEDEISKQERYIDKITPIHKDEQHPLPENETLTKLQKYPHS